MRSLRFQLVFWNTAILAVILLGVSGTTAYLNLQRVDQGINRELIERSRGFGRFGGPGGQGGPGGPGGGGGQRLPNQSRAGQSGGTQGNINDPPREPFGDKGQPPEQPGRGPQPGFGQRQGGFRDAASERLAQIRRPRVMDIQGRSLIGPEMSVALDLRALRDFKGGPLFTETTFDGERIRVYTIKAPPSFGEDGFVQLGRELRDIESLRRVQAITLSMVLPFAIIVAVLAGRFLTGRAMNPIGNMAQAAQAIGKGRFDERIAVQGDDEFAGLGRQFNVMAEQVGHAFERQEAAYAELAKAYEQQRQFVANASHELRTPLTRLQLVTSSTLSDPDGDLRRAVEVADESAQSMAVLVKQLLELAKADAGELKPQLQVVDVRAFVADVVEDQHGADRIDVILPDAPVHAPIDPVLMARALENLIENGLRYGGESPIEVSVSVEENHAVIAVRDFGAGVSPEHLPRLAERFYRTDDARNREAGGTGLGLAIVQEIMKAHGGSLRISSSVGEGTVACLHLAANA